MHERWILSTFYLNFVVCFNLREFSSPDEMEIIAFLKIK